MKLSLSVQQGSFLGFRRRDKKTVRKLLNLKASPDEADKKHQSKQPSDSKTEGRVAFEFHGYVTLVKTET